MLEDEEFSNNQSASDNEQKFWILVNKAEAYYGLGEKEEYKKARLEAQNIDHAAWMIEAFDRQVEKLEKILDNMGT
jgi:hypothetical protein